MARQVVGGRRRPDRRLAVVGRGGGRFSLRLRRLADTPLAVAGNLGAATHRLYAYELTRGDGLGGITVTREVAAVVIRGAVQVALEPDQRPRPCTSCLGEGVLQVRTCRHHGICPCTPAELACESCSGSGHVQCEYCGEDDGVLQTPDGLFCAKCAGEVAHA